jgi:hypothetical protein
LEAHILACNPGSAIFKVQNRVKGCRVACFPEDELSGNLDRMIEVSKQFSRDPEAASWRHHIRK